MSVELLIREVIFSSKYKPWRHILFWVFIYVDELLSLVGLTEEIEFPQTIIVQFLLDVLTLYPIMYLMMPRFLMKMKYGIFLFLMFIMIFVNNQLYLLFENHYYYYEDGHLSIYISSFVTTASIIGLAMAIKLLKNQVTQSEERQELIKEKNKVELQALIDQVNPHFLFNVLNTIYVQTKTDSEAASESIMKLSDLLRFQIYDAADKEWIAYQQEKIFLQNYLDLEIMRRDGLSYEWIELDTAVSDISIPTFLFLPIIENAIKHSRTTLARDETIEIEVYRNDQYLILRCINNIGDIVHKEGGFGINNLKKRLEMLFVRPAELAFEEKAGIFKAELSLPRDELYNHR